MCISQDVNDKVICFVYMSRCWCRSGRARQKKTTTNWLAKIRSECRINFFVFVSSPFPRSLFVLFQKGERICDKLQFDLLVWWSLGFVFCFKHCFVVFFFSKTVFQFYWRNFFRIHSFSLNSDRIKKFHDCEKGNIWITAIIFQYASAFGLVQAFGFESGHHQMLPSTD